MGRNVSLNPIREYTYLLWHNPYLFIQYYNEIHKRYYIETSAENCQCEQRTAYQAKEKKWKIHFPIT